MDKEDKNFDFNMDGRNSRLPSTNKNNSLPANPNTRSTPNTRTVDPTFGNEVSYNSLDPNDRMVVNKANASNSTKPSNNVNSKNTNNSSSTSKNNELDKASMKKRKKRNLALKILLWVAAGILGLVLGVVCFGLFYKNYLMSQITFETVNTNPTIIDEKGQTVELSDLVETTVEPLIESDDISNFLLIGIDSRARSYSEDGTGALADVIMIMSINSTEGTVKLISIARDSYVYVPGYSNPMKINAAMSRGGPELLQLTIENTLRLDLNGYAYVNFHNMANVIDAVGGVYVYASSSEVYGQGGLNTNLAEINAIQGLDPAYQAVNNTGNIWLNGRQAVAYARIRHIGNGDYERSERQVEVLRSLMDSFMNMGLASKATVIDDILSCITTNISEQDITEYALDFLPSITNLEMQYLQLPLDGFFNSGMYGGEWSIRNNWNETIPYVQEFFYGETVPFDLVPEIPSSPSPDSCPDDFSLADHIQ